MEPAFYQVPYSFRARLRIGLPDFSCTEFEELRTNLMRNGWNHELEVKRDSTILTATYHSAELYREILRPDSEENDEAQRRLAEVFNRTLTIIAVDSPPFTERRRSITDWANERLGRPYMAPPPSWERTARNFDESVQRFNQSVAQTGLSVSAAAAAVSNLATAFAAFPAAAEPSPPSPPAPKSLPVHIRPGVRKIQRAAP